MRASNLFKALCLIAWPVLSVAPLLCATDLGIGLSPDSTVYLEAASNLVAGDGLSIQSTSNATTILTHYPPLYPVLLSGGRVLNVDPMAGARYLNLLLFGLNSLLVGLAILSVTRGRLGLAVAGQIMMLISYDMLHIHTYAWSEPAFIFFCLGGLLLLARSVDRSQRGVLVTSALLAGLAVLTRYAGMALVGAGVLALALLPGGTWRARLGAILTFGIVSVAPLLVWLAITALSGGEPTNRNIVFHPVPLAKVVDGFITISYWWLPEKLLQGLPLSDSALIAIRLLLTVELLTVWILFLRKRLAARRRPDIPPAGGQTSLPRVLAIFSLAYVLFLLFSISFLDAYVPLNARILSPLFVSLLVLAFYTLDVTWKARSRALTVALAALAILLTGFLAEHALTSIREFHAEGRGYNSRAWQASKTMNYVAEIRPGTTIYTNAADVVFIRSGKHAYWFPRKDNPTTRLENTRYPADLSAMQRDLERSNGVVVYFNVLASRDYFPTGAELQQALGLEVLYAASDGTIYGVAGAQTSAE